ncbi:MAG TPA: Maf family protein [Anaerolineales bacterium]|nr:Maf family protein [Anaerolineales bacterium]
MKAVLTLASNSPRRRELIALGGWMFHVRPAEIDETPHPGEPPVAYVLRMAVTKALAAREQLNPGGIAVAADTTVADGGEILGKPSGPKEAVELLWRLRGRAHLVHTAIAVIRPGESEPLTDLCTTEVPMREYGDEEIFAYVQSGDPYDKAGGYAIQHQGFRPVGELTGCFANVMGLPLCHLSRTLAKLNLPAADDVAANCQAALHYDCPVHARILAGEG